MRGAGVAPPSGLRFICRELHGSKFAGQKPPTNGKPSVTISLERFQPPTLALRSQELLRRDPSGAQGLEPVLDPDVVPRHAGEAVPADRRRCSRGRPSGSTRRPRCPGRACRGPATFVNVGFMTSGVSPNHDRAALGECGRRVTPGRGPAPGSRAADRCRRGKFHCAISPLSRFFGKFDALSP